MNEYQHMGKPNGCLEADQLMAWIDGALSGQEANEVMAHLASCARCTVEERALRSESQRVFELLSHLDPAPAASTEPAAAFARFQTRLYERSRAAGLAQANGNMDAQILPLSGVESDASLPARPSTHRRRPVALGQALVAAVIIAALLGSALLLLRSHAPSPEGPPKQTPSTTQPAKAYEAGLSNCKGTTRVAANSGAIPRSLYFGDNRGNLNAVNAQTGNLRWCIHLNNLGPQIAPPPCPGPGCLPLPSYVTFGTPAVVDGVVYVCASSATGGETGYTYAFNASDGSPRWRTQSDCWSVAMPFGDSAIPLVENGVVYSGLSALRAQDGRVLWKETHINLARDGGLILLAVADGVLYASSESAVYAFNAADGSILWRYPPHANMVPGGPLIVSQSSHTLIVGTQGPDDQPETSAVYAINTDNGTLRWYHLMGDAYAGAVFINNQVFVSSRDQYLYALNAGNGKVLWRHKFTYPTYNPALAVNGTLYINVDGAYALNSADGSILWHQLLGFSQSNTFSPSVVAGGIDYLVSTDGYGKSILYALNASSGREYWHSTDFNMVSPLAIA